VVLRVAIVGPGRVGQAFGRRFVQAGVELLGFVGRRPAGAAAAVKFAGGGRVLQVDELATAHAVVFAVGDAELRDAVLATATAVPPRRCSLWLHTSGRHGLDVLDPAAERGARRGALHPVAPFADAEAGFVAMAGCPAVLACDARGERLLRQLARRLGMVPVNSRGGDRTLYHAACALAANGLVVLRGHVDAVFRAAGGLSAADARLVADALMTAAVRTSSELGPAPALSGPVLRGDVVTVEAHLAAIAGSAPQAEAVYRALMLGAVDLAVARGLGAAAAAALRAALAGRGARP
jgi:predicted short-subunit dehydrogenase-like oxidoreductase (DUF2520 family)